MRRGNSFKKQVVKIILTSPYNYEYDKCDSNSACVFVNFLRPNWGANLGESWQDDCLHLEEVTT